MGALLDHFRASGVALAAENARQYDPELKGYYDRLRANGKHYLTAMCATAARLLEKAHARLAEHAEEGQNKESPTQSIGTG